MCIGKCYSSRYAHSCIINQGAGQTNRQTAERLGNATLFTSVKLTEFYVILQLKKTDRYI